MRVAWIIVVVAVLSVNARAPQPVDPRFHDQFWRELQFDDLDEPGVRIAEGSRPALWDGSPDPYGRDRFRMPDIYVWRANAPAGTIRHIREHLPGLWMEMTGRPFTGRIRDGVAEFTWQPHTIGIRFVFEARRPDGRAGVCGRAAIGPDLQGWTRITLNPDCIGDPHGLFATTFAHELGHALGFFHVGHRNAVMNATDWTEGDWPTPRERYHMRLAYEVGSQAYCGWPHGPTCEGVRGRLMQPSAVRPVVVD